MVVVCVCVCGGGCTQEGPNFCHAVSTRARTHTLTPTTHTTGARLLGEDSVVDAWSGSVGQQGSGAMSQVENATGEQVCVCV